MILQPKQAKRFYRIFDSLMVYAHKRLGTGGRLFNGYGEIDDRQALEVTKELWGTPENLAIIDDFVRENPMKLSRQDLAEASSWKQGIKDFFILVRRGSDVFALYVDYAIALRGLTQEIDTMLNTMPSAVETVLLPFDGRIVYALSVEEYPVNMGPTIGANMERELDEAIGARKVIKSGRELIAKADELKRAALDQRAEEFARQTELDMNADAEVEGQHRGVLAGLDPAERERVVNEQTKQLARSFPRAKMIEMMASSCFRGAPATTIDGVLGKLNKSELQDMAYGFGVRGAVSAMKKGELIEAVKPRVPRSRDQLLQIMRVGGLRDVQNIRRLVESGGLVVVRDSEVETFSSVIAPIAPLALTYHRDGVFTTVMPADALAQLRDVDWDAEERRAREWEEVETLLSLMVDLRGVVYLGEALDELVNVHGMDARLLDEGFTEALMMAAERDAATFELSFYHDEPILANTLMDLGVKNEAGFQRLVESVLAEQGNKPVRPVSQELRDAGEVARLVLKCKEAQDFMAYLNEHVPDEADDYFFAEDVTLEIIDQSRDLINPAEALHVLERHGFLPTEAQLKRLLELIMNLTNAVPKWTNNGWAPTELETAIGGR